MFLHTFLIFITIDYFCFFHVSIIFQASSLIVSREKVIVNVIN